MNLHPRVVRIIFLLVLSPLVLASLGVSSSFGQRKIQVPTTAEGINDNYETLKRAVDRAEKSLKEAVADGNADNVKARRRNLEFYSKSLVDLENAATSIAKMAKDSQLVLDMTALRARITKILSDPNNKISLQTIPGPGSATIAIPPSPSGQYAGFVPGGGLEFVVGGNLAFAATQNSYEDFPGFSSAGLGAGGHVALRGYLQSGLFAGLEIGGLGASIRGTNPDGAFVNFGGQIWQMAQLGFTWTPPTMTAPITFYGGAGITQWAGEAGLAFNFTHESMRAWFNGSVFRVGTEVLVAPKVSIGASYQYSQFRGSLGPDPLKAQTHMILLSADFHIF